MFFGNVQWVGAVKNVQAGAERSRAQVQAAAFIKKGYAPKLAPGYKFPLKLQTQNACYFFAVRNILNYKYGTNLDIKKLEKETKKDRNKISSIADVDKFNKAAGVKVVKLRTMKSFFESLQKGEPLIVTYMYQTKNKKGEKVGIPHIVAAYSFDGDGVWVAETVSGQRKRIPYEEIFMDGKSRYNPIWSVAMAMEKK